MIRIGICGGTFDPFHNGHLTLITSALDSGRIDSLLVIPAGTPPHKMSEPVMPAIYRYEMTRKSLRDVAHTEVTELEILKEGRSYTLDTVMMVKAKYHDDVEISLVYGSDIINDLEKWHEPAALLAECKMLLAVRGGDDHERVKQEADRLSKKFNTIIDLFAAPQIELSSTELREKIISGTKWQKLVPKGAESVISHNGFYSLLKYYQKLTENDRIKLASLEREIWPYLNHKRMIHSANVMLYSLMLADLHDVDLMQAATAGLLHDCAKCLPHDELIGYAQTAGDDLLLEDDLAHGPAGAVMARDLFGVTDPAVLRSIHYHTTGCSDMTRLDKIIFLADKIELGRTYDDLDPIREAAVSSLNRAMLLCLSEVEAYLRRSSKLSHPYALAAVDSLR
ncbi:MAG: nicotinate (nicotinamide) nucleotide adenylyltransferase [Eubacteriales bacterium]|nr:nicotinate (nicotinamide) nucleotide adenylyltransferase [Eubacteriales bacterium]